MSRPVAPKHRAPRAGLPGPFHPTPQRAAPPRHRAETAVGSRRRTAVLPAAAIAGAGLAVTATVGGAAPSATTDSEASSAERTEVVLPVSAEDRAELDAVREFRTSRSDRRTGVDRTKVGLLEAKADSGGQATKVRDLSSQDPRTVAQALLPEFGFSADQFSCLDALWTKESGWNVHADNPSSSAYGIPQALPGSKMASAGADWASNPATQIRWGLGYIAERYGSPCGAWGHSQSYNWY